MSVCRALVFVLCIAATAACSDSPSGPGTTPGAGGLGAPSLNTPADGEQLTTLRPTFVVSNATSNQGGARVYEFQISDRTDFVAASTLAGFTVFENPTAVAEGAGTTSYTPAIDFQPATRMYWRVRATQGGNTSDWSATRAFNSQIVGFSRAGALYDPLTANTTIGNPVGSTTFVTGKGIRLNDQNAHVRYQLAQTIANGEMSIEVEGLYPNGPGEKMKIFSMMDGTPHLLASKYNMSAQYRGINGNPPNAISFKAVFGDEDFKLEPDLGQRQAAVMSLDPARTYFWKATWNSEFRLVVQEGRGGRTLYERAVPSQGSTYAPNPHMAFVGASNAPFGEEAGSWANAIYRNLWIGNVPRPATLGNAVN